MDNFEEEQIRKAAQLLSMALGYSQGRNDEHGRKQTQFHVLSPTFNTAANIDYLDSCLEVKKSKRIA